MANYSKNFPKGMPANFTWGGNGENVGDLPVHMRRHEDGSTESISCWELTPGEYQEVVRTGKVYLSIYGMHPPVYVGSALQFDLEEPDEPSYLAEHVRQGNSEAEVRRLREALAFARSVIKSGETWSEECERMLTLEPRDEKPPGTPDPPGPVNKVG